MAELNIRTDIKRAEQTLAAIETAVQAERDDGLRPHLGASLIGRECERALWLTFRWAKPQAFEGRMLRLFARGQREEQIFIDLLRAAGIEVVDVDTTTGKQFTFAAIGGHFGGSMDAACQGLPESSVWHVCEMKTHSKKSFDDLEKVGVKLSKPTHYDQMQCYMGWTGMTRALYMAVCKDDDRLHLERIDADPARFEVLMNKAERIIKANQPPPRISEDATWYQCKMCEFHELCHGTTAPIPTCRSCCHSTPELDGNARWFCTRHKTDLTVEHQKEGCQGHLIIPQTMDRWAEVLDASLNENWVMYRHRETDAEFRNGLSGECFQSLEIHAVDDKRALTDATVGEIRRTFEGRIVG